MKNEFLKSLGATCLQFGLGAATLSPAVATGSYYRVRNGSYQGKTRHLADVGFLPTSAGTIGGYGSYAGLDTDDLNELSSTFHFEKGRLVKELLLVDSDVQNRSLFYKQQQPGVEVVAIPKEGGVLAVIEILSRYQNLDAIHVVSHAKPGALLIGGQELNKKELENNIGILTSINQTVKAGGDLLFYGCELGKGNKGEAFLEIIKGNTHADVAASTDLTGNVSYGGNWELELTKGDIKATPLPGSIALKDFTGVLQTWNFNPADKVNSGGYTASDNVSFNETGGTNYELIADGLNQGTHDNFNLGVLYSSNGAFFPEETSVTFYLASGATFDLSSFNLYGKYVGRTFYIESNLGDQYNSGAGIYIGVYNDDDLFFTGFEDITSFTITGSGLFAFRMDDLVLSNITGGTAPTAGTVAFGEASINPGDELTITVEDADLNTDGGIAETVNVEVDNSTNGENETVMLTETGNDTGIFSGTLSTSFGESAGTDDDSDLTVKAGDDVDVTYTDVDPSGTITDDVTITGGTTGTIAISESSINAGESITITVTDADLNEDPTLAETVNVELDNGNNSENETVILTETDTDTGVFSGTLATAFGTVAGSDDDGTLTTQGGDVITATYSDALTENGGSGSPTDGVDVFTLITWDGETDTDWETASNWDGDVVPTSAENVLLPDVSGTSGNDPEIDGDVEVNDLEIEDQAYLTLLSGSLIVNGNVTNEGDDGFEAGIIVEAGASLLLLGDYSGTSDVDVYRQFDLDFKYNMFSSPFSDVGPGDLSFLLDFIYIYDNNVPGFVTPSAGATPGKGAFISDDSGTLEFALTGTPNVGDVTIGITVVSLDGGDDYNLVGNPYTAALDAATFFEENSSIITGTAYLWNDGGANVSGSRQGNYVTVNSLGVASGTVSPSGGVGDGTTSKGTGTWDGSFNTYQGFFVEATSTASLTFTSDMLITGDNGNGSYFRTSNNRKKLRLSISGNELEDNILVALDDEATTGIDYSMDGKKFSGNDLISFYAIQEEEQYAIVALPQVAMTTSNVPLGFDLAESGTYELKVESMENFEDVTASILDRQTGQIYTLTENTAIPFEINSSAKNEQRFELVFATENVLATEGLDHSLALYGDPDELTIQFQTSGKELVSIVDLSGKLIFNEEVEFQGSKAVVSPFLRKNQVYVLRIQDQSITFILK